MRNKGAKSARYIWFGSEKRLAARRVNNGTGSCGWVVKWDSGGGVHADVNSGVYVRKIGWVLAQVEYMAGGIPSLRVSRLDT